MLKASFRRYFCKEIARWVTSMPIRARPELLRRRWRCRSRRRDPAPNRRGWRKPARCARAGGYFFGWGSPRRSAAWELMKGISSQIVVTGEPLHLIKVPFISGHISIFSMDTKSVLSVHVLLHRFFESTAKPFEGWKAHSIHTVIFGRLDLGLCISLKVYTLPVS